MIKIKAIAGSLLINSILFLLLFGLEGINGLIGLIGL